MKYGYVRLSLNEPDPAPQLKALRRAGVQTNTIYTDRISGTKTVWPYLARALSRLEAGDTFIVWRLDRLGKSLKHLIETVTALTEQGVVFKSLSENIDTSSPSGMLLIKKFWVIAAFEKRLNTEQTMVGIQQARARGKRPGRPPSTTSAKARKAQKLHAEKTPIPQILKALNISRATLYRYVNLDGEPQTHQKAPSHAHGKRR